jgi:putative restriction endonuclease
VIGFVGVTDFAWYAFLRERRAAEVNFWQPSGGRAFRAVRPGAPFFFKLKRPHDAIAGFGFFSHHSVVPDWLAWQTFGEGNGAPDLATLRRSIARLRRDGGGGDARATSFPIGCIMLRDCTFFAEHEWMRVPADFARNVVQGKTYDLRSGEGARLWQECRLVAGLREGGAALGAEAPAVAAGGRYGAGTIVRPRLGQRSFRIAVLDAYGRACAVSTEHSLPVLESAHIKPYAEGGEHDVANGICMRADIHKLFDAGYVTVDEDRRFVVSRRLKDDWDNGRVYYEWDKHPIHLPRNRQFWPDGEALEWHRRHRFIA